jgi:hypothetical protein
VAELIIGTVNGEDITYQEFQTALDQQIENQKRQTGKNQMKLRLIRFENKFGMLL